MSQGPQGCSGFSSAIKCFVRRDSLYIVLCFMTFNFFNYLVYQLHSKSHTIWVLVDRTHKVVEVAPPTLSRTKVRVCMAELKPIQGHESVTPQP